MQYFWCYCFMHCFIVCQHTGFDMKRKYFNKKRADFAIIIIIITHTVVGSVGKQTTMK